MMRRRRLCAAAVPVLLMVGASPAIAATATSAPSSATAPITASAPSAAVPPALTKQHLSWSTCYPGEGVPRLKCASVTVPVDWAKPSGKTLHIEISRIKAANPSKRRGVLFTNPGGPGEPGLSLPLFIPEDEPSVAAAYDIIGMDVRGVGESRPTFSCAKPWILNSLYNLDGLDTSPANQARFRQLSQRYGQVCSTDPLTPYMNFSQMVRDMDLVRTLLGEPRISYLGFSGGTLLGAWYAAVFPQRVDRFVLDGNVDWTGALAASFDRQPKGFQNALDAFLEPWIASYNGIFHLGRTTAAVNATYEHRRAVLAAHPLKLSDGSLLTAAGYDSGIAGALYVTFDYPQIAYAMAALEHYSSASAAQKRLVAQMFGGSAAAGADPFLAIVCQTDKQESWSQIEHETANFRVRYPLLGATWNANPCPFFHTPIDTSPIQPKALPRLLMLNNSDDPATPLANALIARSHTPNARLVTVLNESDHTIYGYGDTCADGYANRWLLAGTLPAHDAVCPGIPLPRRSNDVSSLAGTAQGHRPPAPRL